ncbi:MAG: hypothetical protein EPO46_09675 [Lysobacter sp.]|nr:MAG: hypothetical protein EPO46_09675 [Lysobacter sp.]
MQGIVRVKLDLYRRTDGALVVVPSRFAHALPGPGAATLHYIRTVRMELALLGDALVLEIGLQGFAIARGADAALLRNGTRVPGGFARDSA